jgi:hypothetical protein
VLDRTTIADSLDSPLLGDEAEDTGHELARL